VRGLVRAAAYLPPGTADGRRVAGSDEDALTLGATAVERVSENEGRTKDPVSLELLGDYPTVLEWAVPFFLGAPASIARSAATGTSLVASLARAEAGEGGAAVVLVIEMPERGGAPSRPSSAPGAGAVAFWFEEGRGQPLPEAVASLVPGPTALGTSFEVFRCAAGSAPSLWVGDWSADARSGRAVDLQRIAPLVGLSTSAVSQGAYVPRPRYIENLPSRWRFVAERCATCGALSFPARGVCRFCGRVEGLRSLSLPRDGAEVVAATVIGSGGQPTEFDPQVGALGSYEVVLAELAPGVRVTLQVADAEPGTVRIGDRVDTRLRRLYAMDGEWRYGRKAVPRPVVPVASLP
jgi:uncharacterized OB-fold protein